MRTHIPCTDCPVECTATKARTHQPSWQLGRQEPRGWWDKAPGAVLKHFISSVKINVKSFSYQNKADEARGHSDTGSLVSYPRHRTTPPPSPHSHPSPLIPQLSHGRLMVPSLLPQTFRRRSGGPHPRPILQLFCALFSFVHSLGGWKGAGGGGDAEGES